MDGTGPEGWESEDQDRGDSRVTEDRILQIQSDEPALSNLDLVSRRWYWKLDFRRVEYRYCL